MPVDEWEFWGLLFFALIVLIPQGLLFPKIRLLGHKHDNSPCLICSDLCCVEPFKEKLSEKFGSSIVLDDNTMSEYHLTCYKDMQNTVSMFASDHIENIQKSFRDLIFDDISEKRLSVCKRKIWYFSYNISIDSFLGKIQSIPEIQNGEIEFVYFFIKQDSPANREKEKFKEMNPKSKFKFIQIPIQQRDSLETINVLPEMLGSVIFIFQTRETSSFASFFVLKSKSKDSVYFRMPYCMNEDYYEYFSHLAAGGKK